MLYRPFLLTGSALALATVAALSGVDPLTRAGCFLSGNAEGIRADTPQCSAAPVSAQEAGHQTLLRADQRVQPLPAAYGHSSKDGAPSSDPQPTLAVLPFYIIEGSVREMFLVDRLTDDVIVALSRAPELQVLSRNTAFAYRGWAFDLVEFMEKSGGRYVVDVGIRLNGENDVAELNLYDAERMELLLDEKIGIPHEHVGNISGIVSRKVADALALSVDTSSVPSRKWPQDAKMAATTREAWDLLWSEPESAAMHSLVWRSMEKVLQSDPDDAMAWTGLSYAQLRLNALGIGEPERSLANALDAARRAVALDPELPQANYVLGYALRETGDVTGSRQQMETCLALNPNNASCLQGLAYAEVLSGRPAAAVPLLETAIRLSPREPLLAEWHWLYGFAHAMVGSFDKAAVEAKKVIESDEYSIAGYELLAAAEAGLGHEDRAREAAESYRRWAAGKSMSTMRSRYEALSSHHAYRARLGAYLQHLTRAGIETGAEHLLTNEERRG